MILLFGVRDRLREVGQGMFRCPVEDADRAYALMSARRWFTLFFVPVIPLGGGREHVECKGCGNAFDASVVAGAR